MCVCVCVGVGVGACVREYHVNTCMHVCTDVWVCT